MNEEQEVILSIESSQVDSAHGINGETTHHTAKQHERYLAAIINEHKAREATRKEALLVEAGSDEEEGRVEESSSEGGEGGDTRKMDHDEANDDADDDASSRSRRDSGIEEKSASSGAATQEAGFSLFNPLDFNNSLPRKKHVSAQNGRLRHNGVESNCQNANNTHPRLTYSSSSDTAKPPRKTERKTYPRRPVVSPPRPEDVARSSSGTGSEDANPARINGVKPSIESRGGVRVFPLIPGGEKSHQNGGFNLYDELPGRSTARRGGLNRRSPAEEAPSKRQDELDSRESLRPAPAPRDSPSVRRLRCLKAPPAYSDFESERGTTGSDLDSFMELTDL